jgi:nitrile hydratase
MNGAHDMGGMHGFGPVQPEADEPVFHARWERRVFALRMLVGGWRKWNIDAGRHSIERIPPADYLRWSYYEKWLESLVLLTREHGLLSAREIATGRADPARPRQTPPIKAADVPPMLARGGPSARDVPCNPRFGPGDRVRARNIHPTGHTRLPRYARGRVGIVERHHGPHVLPDSNAHFLGEQPQVLYTVRFAARELWGDEAPPADAVFIDLWESYLEPA